MTEWRWGKVGDEEFAILDAVLQGDVCRTVCPLSPECLDMIDMKKFRVSDNETKLIR